MSAPTDIKPVAGSRSGWAFKKFLRVGLAEAQRSTVLAAHLPPTVADRYGVYGRRGVEVFVQHEGYRLADGSILGKSVVMSSTDGDVYFWTKAEHLTSINYFGQD